MVRTQSITGRRKLHGAGFLVHQRKAYDRSTLLESTSKDLGLKGIRDPHVHHLAALSDTNTKMVPVSIRSR